jgi:cell division septation protein DedD
MSRLDYVTISIVGVCIVAIILLLVKTNDLLNANESQNREALERHLEEMGLEDTADFSHSNEKEEEVIEEKVESEEEGGDEIKYDEKIDPPVSEPAQEEPKKEIVETKPAPPPTVTKPSKGAFAVLGGSFKQKINADNLVKQLSDAGFKNATVEISPGGAYARVIVDRFNDKSAADKLAAQLKAKGFESFVKGN